MTELVAHVAEGRARVAAAVAGLTEAHANFRSAPGEWSIVDNVEHLVLAEQSGLMKIWQSVDAVRAGTPVFTGEHTNIGLPIEEVIRRTWKDREVAPPIATPHLGGALGYWLAALDACQPVLEKVCDHLGDLDPETVIFPHYLSGPLDARQRVAFLRFHMDRHVLQIEAMRKRAVVLAANA